MTNQNYTFFFLTYNRVILKTTVSARSSQKLSSNEIIQYLGDHLITVSTISNLRPICQIRKNISKNKWFSQELLSINLVTHADNISDYDQIKQNNEWNYLEKFHQRSCFYKDRCCHLQRDCIDNRWQKIILKTMMNGDCNLGIYLFLSSPPPRFSCGVERVVVEMKLTICCLHLHLFSWAKVSVFMRWST